MRLLHILHICLLLFVAVTSMIISFIDLIELRILLAISASILVIVLFTKTSGILRISYSAFFILSIFLSMYFDIGIRNMIDALISNTIYIALFVFTPLIKIPIDNGRYLEKLIPKMKNVPHERLSPMLIFSNYIICAFLSVGGLRVMGEIFVEAMKKTPKLFGAILSRTFSSVAFWTPYFSAFSIAIAYSGGNPALILIIGLFFSMLTMIIWSVLIFKNGEGNRKTKIFSISDIYMIAIIITYFCLLVLTVILLTHYTDYEFIFIISVVSILFSILWSMFSGKLIEYIKAFKGFFSEDLLKIKEEAFLFIAIGFFSNTLMKLQFEFHLPTIVSNSPILVFLFIILFNMIVIGVSVTGVHHLVTITLLTTMIDWQDFGITPVIFALTILLSWWLSAMVSPFSPPNLITARFIDSTAFQVGVKTNGLFAIYVLIGGAVYLTLINSFL